MIKEALILAGGLGTRLRSVVDDVPKCMAPVAGKPFLHYVIAHLKNQGIQHFIFSLGYLHEQIENYLQQTDLDYSISLENEPLGTGGAIKLGCEKARGKSLLICNGDTLYQIDVAELSAFHFGKNSECTLALKPMKNFDRYGVVAINSEGRITSFKEKMAYESGLINGGVYALQLAPFLNEDFPEKFSFEKDYLEKKMTNPDTRFFGLEQESYFIDIGIPEDFAKANIDFTENSF